MATGPLEYLVIGFEGNKFTGEILPELQSLRDQGIIRVDDLFFVMKDQDGNVVTREVSDLSEEEAKPFGPFAGDLLGLFTDEDMKDLASSIPNNCSAGVLLFEDMWAVKLRDAILRANGVLFDAGRISLNALEELSAELAATQVGAQAQGAPMQ